MVNEFGGLEKGVRTRMKTGTETIGFIKKITGAPRYDSNICPNSDQIKTAKSITKLFYNYSGGKSH